MFVGIFNPLTGSHRAVDLTERSSREVEFTYGFWHCSRQEDSKVSIRNSYPKHEVVASLSDMTITIEHLKFRVFERRSILDEWLYAQALGG